MCLFLTLIITLLFSKYCFRHLYYQQTLKSHLSPFISVVVGAPQMTLQQYLSTLPCLPLPSGNLQTPCLCPFLDVIFPSFLLLFSPSCSFHCPLQNYLCHARRSILRCGHTIWVSVSSPRLGDHHVLQLHSGFSCEAPCSSHGFCRKCSEVFHSISSQGLGSFSRVCQGPALTGIKEDE